MKKGKTETLNLFGPENVMAQAKKETMEAAALDGATCPCCEQFVKVYKRTITSTMARQLIHAWRCHGTMAWFHLRNVVMDSSGAGDFSKLEMWGMIEKQHHQQGDEGKRTSGIWRITQKGDDFIHGRLRVHSHAAVYNSKFLEFIGEPEAMGIAESLGNHFDYRVLMGWVIPDASQQPGTGV